jgi:hypothetical protein
MKSTGILLWTAVLAACLGAGCSTVTCRTQPALGGPRFAASDPARVVILTAEPARAKDRLGEIFISVEGSPSRDRIENKLKKAAAGLGADAVVIASDQTHLFPVVYGGWWGATYTQEAQRGIVGVAVKYK